MRLALSLIVLTACAAETDDGVVLDDSDAGKADASGYTARIWATPYPIQPGVETTLSIKLYSGGTRIRDFDLLHTMPLHFATLAHDHGDFQHVHPTLRSDGSFETRVTFAEASPYTVALEFDPAGAAGAQLVRGTLVPAGATSEGPCDHGGCYGWDGSTGAVHQHVDDIATSFDNVEIRRTDADTEIHACEDVPVRYAFADASGRYQDQFATWLGMAGHDLVFSEDNHDFVHLHGMVQAGTTPGVVFHTFLPHAGRYESFAQFMLGGDVITVRQWLYARDPLPGADCAAGGEHHHH